MTVLHIVPGAYLRQIRRRLSKEGQPGLAVTLGGLAAQILRANLASYREDRLLEEVALWQSVADLGERLEFFAPIAQFGGFIQELKWLFSRLDYGEEIYASMPERGRAELELLHARYHEILDEHGVVNAPGQLKLALEVMGKAGVLPEVEVLRLEGLGELRPLEQQFLQALAEGRTVEKLSPPAQEPVLTVTKAADPAEEVEMMGQALRSQIEQGVSIEQLAAAFPNPRQYLPLLMPAFERLQIPWQMPGTSLRNTPLGKTLLTLIAGELAGWDKHSLELLTAPGWGFPFGLSGEEHRRLRLAPPLNGLPAWRSYLEQQSGWEPVFKVIARLGQGLRFRPLHEYGLWLEGLLGELDPELWVRPQDGLENWVELVKAWDGLHSIAQTLKEFHWALAPGQFLQLVEGLLDSYLIRPKRVFAQRVLVLSTDQLGACTYQHLYVGGLVEGQFPPHTRAHWLTKTRAEIHREEVFSRLLSSAQHLHLYYPEVDREGKLNLPATVLPKVEEQRTAALQPIHYPSLFFGNGQLRDGELLERLREKFLKHGLSVSQLNTYSSCPFRFFCAHVLDLEVLEEESLDVDARDKGIIVHEVLRTFWEQHFTGPLPSVEEGQLLVEELLNGAYQERGSQPPADLIRSMRSFIRRDLQRVQGGFRPAYVEREFGNVAIPSAYGPVLMRGRIDRIDCHPDGAYVLYDYKTGSNPPKVKSMLEGKDVQIAAYLLAAKTLLPQGRSVGAAYYLIKDAGRPGLFHEAYQTHLGLQKGNSVLSQQEFSQQQEQFEQILAQQVNSILEGAFPIEPEGSNTCRYCPFRGICRKEVGYSDF